MTRITEELVRRRAEHNDGCITDLKEITLHQFEIERVSQQNIILVELPFELHQIENLGQLCRHLEILFLQNNLIPKIENLQKLQQMKYLNLAINNITKIENLEYCEALEKLDLTANFVDDLLSVASLEPNYNLKELYLIGNPVTKHPKYRAFIVASVPSLKYLDGEEVTPEERAAAIAELPEIKVQLLDEKAKGLKLEEIKFTPEDRVKVYQELAEKRGETAEKAESAKKEKPIPPPPAPGETARGINQAKLEFKLLEDDENIILDLECGNSLIQVDAQPTYVRIIIKGKLFQLPLPEEVSSDAGTARRSTLTGNLVLTLPKTKQLLASKNKPKAPITFTPQAKKAPSATTKDGNGSEEGLRGTVDIRNIVSEAEKAKAAAKVSNSASTPTKKKEKSDEKVVYDFDESEVPPLE